MSMDDALYSVTAFWHTVRSLAKYESVRQKEIEGLYKHCNLVYN